MFNCKIPIAEYAALAKDFNPVNYDAERWVLAAKNAGMKYLVITAKHHEGFAMFKSAASPFNIVDATPFRRDPLKELAAACRKHGLKLGFYYSQNYDWHHPGGALNDWDPASKGDYDKYTDELVISQLREILTHYGEIAILWYDTGGGNAAQHERIHKAVLDCNPNIIVNDRLGGPYHGDTETPEQNIPANGIPGKDWETCMTMNNTWGYGNNDHNWKSTAELLRNLCKIASKGGNYLLNVGPNELGEIPAASLERLQQVSEWMKVNGAAIYGSEASPFPHSLPWGGVTRKGNSLYLGVNQLPADRKLTLPDLTTKIARAYFLADAKQVPLTVTTTDKGIQTLVVPESTSMAFGENPVVIAAELPGGPIATILDVVIPGMSEATNRGTRIEVQVPRATDLTKLAPIYQTGSPKTYVVTVVPTLGAAGVANPSFEQFDFLNEYDETLGKNPSGASWIFHQEKVQEAGINLLTGPIHAPPAPDGSRYTAFLRGEGSGISQEIHTDAGNFTVSFDAVKRTGYTSAAIPLTVTLDGKAVFTLEAAKLSDTWGSFTTPVIALTAGAHTLAFTAGAGDSMDLIDNVGTHYAK